MDGTARRLRLGIVAAVVLCGAASVALRLFQLQIRDHERLAGRARGQHELTIEVPAVRGAIVDRAGRELAVSTRTESFYAHPRRIAEPRVAAQRLAPLLGQPAHEVLQKLDPSKSFVYLARFLDPEVAAALREIELPGDPRAFGFLPDFKRSYPRGRVAVHVVGYANRDGKGVEGIELTRDQELRGAPTLYLVWRDARGGSLRQVTTRSAAQPPRDVVLTIDLVLQQAVERDLEAAVRASGASAASAIVIEPSTGQVLALANWPAADLGAYGQADDAARVDRAVVHYYEPGSTFKIVPLAAALERGAVQPGQLFDCERGSMTVHQRTIRDVAPRGLIPVTDVLAYSSNIGMVKLTRPLAPSELHATIERFGFGSRTGIELPGESAGHLRPEREWSAFSKASLSFGQEIGVTVLQMASAIAAVANDGVWVGPRIVLGTRDAAGSLEPAPEPPMHRAVSAGTARIVRGMMEAVIDHGTGKRAAVPGYRLAGKSGTAQKAGKAGYSPHDYMASFGGFGPSRRPQVAVLVVLDSPRGAWIHGGEIAAPVFARVMSTALHHLRVPPDEDPHPPAAELARRAARRDAPAAPPIAPRTVPSDGQVPDVLGRGAREAIAALAARGCNAEVVGSGWVVEQLPAPGSEVPADGRCRVVLARPAAAPPSEDAG